MKLRIISNIAGMDKFYREGMEIEHVCYPNRRNGVLSVLKYAWKHRNYDYLIFNGSGQALFLLALSKVLIPFQRVKIVSLDLLLSEPKTFGYYIRNLIRMMLLSRVHMFFMYYKNTQGIQKHFKIPAQKFRYIPFKINQYSKVLSAFVDDLGYVFCGGKTRRDFDTLIEAVRGSSIPVRIVTMDNSDIAEHGSYLNESNIPENVEVIRLDGSFDPFLKQMAESRLVVVPLKPHICGTGIGVYIMAMALKKCVIISADVSIDGVLKDDMAIIVPPCDPVSMRKAIEKAYCDDDYRNKYEVNGYTYAISLGGEERLNESIMNVIIDDYLNGTDKNFQSKT